MLLDMGAENTLTGTIAEARRQIEICNACRYCEGYCAVFPAINRERVFADGDIMQLAHLCHNCRGCYYSCQYIPPHEFAVNIPRILAETRAEDLDAACLALGLRAVSSSGRGSRSRRFWCCRWPCCWLRCRGCGRRRARASTPISRTTRWSRSSRPPSSCRSSRSVSRCGDTGAGVGGDRIRWPHVSAALRTPGG